MYLTTKGKKSDQCKHAKQLFLLNSDSLTCHVSATNKNPKLHQHPTHIPNSPAGSNANSFPSCRLNFSLYLPKKGRDQTNPSFLGLSTK